MNRNKLRGPTIRYFTEAMWKNKNLKKLSLESCELDHEASVRVLEALENNFYLKAVNLSHNGFTEKLSDSISQLFSSENWRLKYINLSNNYLTDEVLKNISVVSFLKSCSSLVLRHNSFNNDGARQIFQMILNNENLSRVDIRRNLISIKYLEEIKSLILKKKVRLLFSDNDKYLQLNLHPYWPILSQILCSDGI